MKAGISFGNIWFDSDVVELKVVVNDGDSIFSNKVYASYSQIEVLVNELNVFKEHIYGGLYDIEFGEFGLEYANGAFSGRLHFRERGKIFISVRMQTDFFDFGITKVASEATLYLVSEPVLLDNFMNQLKIISKQIGNTALLECVARDS